MYFICSCTLSDVYQCESVFIATILNQDNKAITSLIMSYSSEICGKIFNVKKDMMQRNKSIHEEIRFNCRICPKVFTRRHMLHKHNLSHSNVS